MINDGETPSPILPIHLVELWLSTSFFSPSTRALLTLAAVAPHRRTPQRDVFVFFAEDRPIPVSWSSNRECWKKFPSLKIRIQNYLHFRIIIGSGSHQELNFPHSA
eukprot:scaffold681_cov173-Ochromonas_danica.AAC.64